MSNIFDIATQTILNVVSTQSDGPAIYSDGTNNYQIDAVLEEGVEDFTSEMNKTENFMTFAKRETSNGHTITLNGRVWTVCDDDPKSDGFMMIVRVE